MPPRLGTLSRWGRTEQRYGGAREGRKETSNGKRNTYRGRRRASVMVYSREHNSLAHRSMVGNYCKFIRAARFHLPLPSSLPSVLPVRPPSLSPTSAFPGLVFPLDVLHLSPAPASPHARKKSPRPHVPSSLRRNPPVRKPLLAKLKLRHSARNAETIWLRNLWL